VGTPVDETVQAMRRALEQAIDRNLRPYRGCWPLAVGVAGILLGLALLAGWL